MSLGGTNVTLAATASFDTAAAASGLVATIETSLDNLNTALAKLGTGSKALEVHKTFVGKLSDSLEKGIGNLVDADLAKESAPFAVAAGQAAAGHAGPLDRQLGAELCPGLLPVIHSGIGRGVTLSFTRPIFQ